MSYSATVMVGDFCLDNQPDFGKEFDTPNEAIEHADRLYQWGGRTWLPKHPGESFEQLYVYAWENTPGEGFCMDDDDQMIYWRGCPANKVIE